jgi:hypothetical protein
MATKTTNRLNVSDFEIQATKRQGYIYVSYTSPNTFKEYAATLPHNTDTDILSEYKRGLAGTGQRPPQRVLRAILRDIKQYIKERKQG